MSTLPPLGAQRTCCDTVTGKGHRACRETGHNDYGVPMCGCKPFGSAHTWEPGEQCSPTRIIPAGDSA